MLQHIINVGLCFLAVAGAVYLIRFRSILIRFHERITKLEADVQDLKRSTKP